MKKNACCPHLIIYPRNHLSSHYFFRHYNYLTAAVVVDYKMTRTSLIQASMVIHSIQAEEDRKEEHMIEPFRSAVLFVSLARWDVPNEIQGHLRRVD